MISTVRGCIAKVGLLLRKLSPLALEKYSNFILASNTLEEMVALLNQIFGKTESLARRRYKCHQTSKLESEGIVFYYASRVNIFCENFDFRNM